MAPGPGAWRGTSNTVSRPLALIDAGALDRAGVDALAERLGVGGRQLRRLFLRHLGASPVAVAQTRRVLLAKQLIHETDLPMVQVALASGFGSVRRFNETFRALFERAPATLRRTRSTGRAGSSAITLGLGYRPPYDWQAVLGFLAARAAPGVEVVEGGTYRRTIELDGAIGTVGVAHDGGRRLLRVTVRFPCLGALPTIVARLRRMFDLGADPAVIGAALSRDARLGPLVAACPGLRVPGAWDGFETGVRAILGQQVTVAAATRLAGRIARTHGTPLKEGCSAPGLTHAFPRPGALAGVAIEGVPSARAAAVASLAASASSDASLFERGADLDGSVARLRALPGIGEWTAQYIAMRAMREPDAFPAADVGLVRAMDDGRGRPGTAALLARAESWRPWRAYAALHLWTAAARTAEEASHVAPAAETADAFAA